jgi:hypothetical protein
VTRDAPLDPSPDVLNISANLPKFASVGIDAMWGAALMGADTSKGADARPKMTHEIMRMMATKLRGRGEGGGMRMMATKLRGRGGGGRGGVEVGAGGGGGGGGGGGERGWRGGGLRTGTVS